LPKTTNETSLCSFSFGSFSLERFFYLSNSEVSKIEFLKIESII
jgi:hypothetical protein